MTLALRTRLALGSTAVFGVLVGGVSVVTYRVLANGLETDATERVESLARGLHGYLRLDGESASVDAALDDGEQATFIHQATQYYQLYDARSGHLLAESTGIAPLGLQLTPAEVTALDAKPGPFDVQTDFGRFRIATSIGTTPEGRRYLLQVGATLDPIDVALARYRSLLLWRVPGLLFAGGAAFWWFAGFALRPLSRLAAAAERIDIANLEARVPVRGVTDELDHVAISFNRTLAKLERSVGDMRQFSAALAHELRTPLAGLRGHIELAMRTPGNTPSQRDAFASQLEEVDRLTRLINHVLTLARAESGQIRLTMAPVDLDRLVAMLVEQLEMVAEAQSVELRHEPTGSAVFVKGDAGWLERMVMNLVDNAIRYSNAGGRVVVRVSRHDGSAQIDVQDSGVGLSPDDAARVFDRFFRADPARPQSAEGAGLGLSLVRWVATEHGGTVSVQSVRGDGSTFSVRLPLSTSPGPDGDVTTAS